MARKLLMIIFLTLLVTAFLAVSLFGRATSENDKRAFNRVLVGNEPKLKLAGTEGPLGYVPPRTGEYQSLGFDEVASLSPGLTVGYTTYDYQSNGRMNRQVDWRGSQMVHFTWMFSPDSANADRGEKYEAWDPDDGNLIFMGPGGGIDVHALLGGDNRSGYCGLDVDTEGKVNICAHHTFSGADNYAATVWYDFAPGTGYFSPYYDKVPDTLQQSVEGPGADEWHYIWPNHEYHVWGGDTVTHVFGNQSLTSGGHIIAYFRRVGSDTMGAWDYPAVVVDTNQDLAQVVTASRVSGKVAMAFTGGLPEVPGDGESVDGGSQWNNDVYYAMSYDMGATWSTTKNGIDKFNITKMDPTQAGWRCYDDLSALIDTDDILHVIWHAREYSPSPPPSGSFPHSLGARLFHWDESTDEVRVIADANWDVDPKTCAGGAWNSMSITKMQLSECDGKFYAIYVMYNDIFNGIEDDCHEDAFTAGYFNGGGNGEVWVSVSDNGGYNWDIRRNLTNSYTPHCQEGVFECDSDVWPSISRFGMQVTTGDFTGVPIVDPSGEYTGDYFVDVFYVNDKYPGGAVQEGTWTWNPLKWFRVPCINPVPNPVLSVIPSSIVDPAWTKPGVQLDTTIRLENIGNAVLHITSITAHTVTGPAGWLGIGAVPGEISHLSPNYADLDVYLNYGGAVSAGPVGVEAYLLIESDAARKGIDTFKVHLIVADSVQFPQTADIRTDCIRMIFNNGGNIGNGGNPPDGGYNLNFLDDCDTINTGNNDNATVYLYDASPFIMYVNDAGDTVFNCYIFEDDWLSAQGFRPLEGIVADSSGPGQVGSTGKFLTKDSAIAMEVTYYAPEGADDCEFIVMRQKVYNNSDAAVNGIYVGECMDWDVPSDTAVRNGSGFDAVGGANSRDLMYCYGAEYGPDTTSDGSAHPTNDCVYADQRYGGLAFYNGYHGPFDGPDDSLENPAGAVWTERNLDYISGGGFQGGQMLQKMADIGFSGWQVWEPTTEEPEPYQDLHIIFTYGQFDLGRKDTLLFVTILTTTYDGLSKSILDNIDRARGWIDARPEVFNWDDMHFSVGCCDVAGDANNSGSVNMLDITYLISYLYKGGPAPPCAAEGDANASGSINMLDITYLISFLYKGGPAPICGPE